jgi:hypothetical protein
MTAIPPTFTAPTVIPANLKWTVDAANKAGQKHLYILVGTGDKTYRRLLSGARNMWKSTDPAHRDIIYNITYRIAGTPDNVGRALQFAGYDMGAIQKALGESFSAQNYMRPGFSEAIKADITAAHAQKKGGVVKQEGAVESGFILANAIWLADNLAKAVLVTADGQRHGPVASVSSRKESLRERYEKLPAGKVLDVSDLKDDGTGVKKVGRPTKSKSGKFGVPSINLVSKDINTYIHALTSIFGQEAITTYAAAIQQVQNQIDSYKGASMGKSFFIPPPAAVAAPTQQPGAYIASPVNLVAMQPATTPVGTSASGGYGSMPSIAALPPLGQ